MSLEQIIANNPGLQGKTDISLLNVSRHPGKTTERYKPTDDVSIVQTLNDAGWSITSYKQVKSRTVEDRLFKPYLASFENPKLPDLEGEGKFQILQRNAKDGTKSYEFMLGFFRFACENGLIVGTNLFQPIRVRHVGNIPLKIEETVSLLADQSASLYERVKEMKQVQLTDNQVISLTEAAIIIRVGEENKGAMKVSEVSSPRRSQDTGKDLWSVFNVVQENLIKAPIGVSMTSKDGKVSKKARAVKGIDASLRINRELWNLAEMFIQ